MVCFHARRLAAGFFVLIAVLGACGGKKDEGKSAQGQGGAAATSNPDLDLIPAGSDTVFGIDLAKAQQSALFRDYALPMMGQSGDAQQVIELLKSKCDLDPMAAGKRVTAGVKLAGARVTDVVAVVHGIEKAKALPCLDQLKDQLEAKGIAVTRDGDVVVLKGEQGDLAFTFIGDTRVLVVIGGKANKAGVLELAQGKSTLKTSKGFADMYSLLQTTHTLWFLLRGDQELVARNLAMLNIKAKAIFGSVDVSSGLAIRTRIRVESEEQATNLAELAKNQSSTFSGMAEKLEIDRDKADVRMEVSFTSAQLKAVLGFVGPLLRGR